MSSVLSIESRQPDDRPLTPREYAQLQRLLADPFSFPLAFKTWLIAYLESSDLSLPVGTIDGLPTRLGDLERGLRLLQRSTAGGRATGVSDASGALRVNLASPVSAIRSVVLTNHNPAHYNVNFSTIGWDGTGFTIVAWNVPANAALTGAALDVSWYALVSPTP